MSGSKVLGATWLDLYDYRERTARLYRERDAALRAGEADEAVWNHWRAGRDALFASHPQSALGGDARGGFAGLRYFPYNPELRVEARMEPAAEDIAATLPASAAMQSASVGGHTTLFRRAGQLTFTIDEQPAQLLVYWVDVYGGGLFLPFRDATSGHETYGAGRYLFDTVKGNTFLRVDAAGDASGPLGYGGGRILLDFNYAYNPSCAYDARWACPLSPAENRLPFAIRAGELAFHS